MTSAKWLDALSTNECQAHLRSASLGRVAVSIDALPVILPVMYRFADDAIWFFTDEGTKLRAALKNAVVAFEIDHLEHDAGWSVLVIGRSQEIVDADMIDLRRREGLVPAAPGARDHLVRIPVAHISGRSFSNDVVALAHGGYL